MGDVPICTPPKAQNPYKSPIQDELDMNKNLDQGELRKRKQECGRFVRTLVYDHPLKKRLTCWITPMRHPGDSGAGIGDGVGSGSGPGPGSTASGSNNLRSLLVSDPSS